MNFKQEIHDYIKSGETSSKNLGLEIEHFVIDKDGKQISFDQITSLIEKAGKELQAEVQYIDGFPVGYHTDKYAISLEHLRRDRLSHRDKRKPTLGRAWADRSQ